VIRPVGRRRAAPVIRRHQQRRPALVFGQRLQRVPDALDESIGALRGVNFLLYAAVYGALIGGVLAVGFIVSRRLARPAAGAAPNTLATILKSSIPYGVALGIGGLLALALEATGYIQLTV